MVDKKEKLEIEVKALPEFMTRRFLTLTGLSKKQYRALKVGDSIKIPKSAFYENLYQEVKHGNS